MYAYTPYGTQLVMTEDASRNEILYYVYGNGLISQTDQDDRTLVYHYDYRGSTTSLTDIAGNTAAAYTYDTYGRCSRAEIEAETIYGTDYEADTMLRYNSRDGVITDSSGLYCKIA